MEESKELREEEETTVAMSYSGWLLTLASWSCCLEPLELELMEPPPPPLLPPPTYGELRAWR